MLFTWMDFPMNDTAITEFSLRSPQLISLNQTDHLRQL